MALVEVKPIERESWHGRTGKDSFKRPFVLSALVDPSKGKYATGLTDKRREELQKITGYDLADEFIIERIHPFWDSTAAQVKLENRTNVFDTSKALDEIKVAIMKASRYVANSQKEYEQGLFPEALFVIFDEQEEVEIKASKIATRNKAIIETSKLSNSRKAELIHVLSGKSARKQSDDYIDLKISELIDEDPERVMNFINRDKAHVSTHALILEAIHKNVLQKDGTNVNYMDSQIGFDLEDAINYLMNPKNQRLKAEIMEKIND